MYHQCTENTAEGRLLEASTSANKISNCFVNTSRELPTYRVIVEVQAELNPLVEGHLGLPTENQLVVMSSNLTVRHIVRKR